MTHPHTDEALAYHLSLKDEPISALMISRRYGLTNERSKTICEAVVFMKASRAQGEEHWKLIEFHIPPPFREILFSDGHEVFANRLNFIITKKEEIKDSLSWITSKAHGEIKWWREMPNSPWRIYGI